MNLFARPEYESEFTLFLKQLKQSDPMLDEQQRTGRALLWDKSPINPDEQQRTGASQAKRQSYAYE
jgi:hypothetical protein